jgi:putative SOS response-associated peptidase YedK
LRRSRRASATTSGRSSAWLFLALAGSGALAFARPLDATPLGRQETWEDSPGVQNYPPRWNGAPSQDLLVIRRNNQTGELSLDPLRWGLIPYWCQDPRGGRKPINAKCETVRTLPTFREAYRRRRCILPVDGFFEWKAIKGQKAKQPYAIAMQDNSRHWRSVGELEGPDFG